MLCSELVEARQDALQTAGGHMSEADILHSKQLVDSLMQHFWPAAVHALMPNSTGAKQTLSPEQSQVHADVIPRAQSPVSCCMAAWHGISAVAVAQGSKLHILCACITLKVANEEGGLFFKQHLIASYNA